MAPGTMQISRIADEDRFEANFSMSPVVTVLQAITSRAGPQPGRNAPTPGDLGGIFSTQQLMRLPIDLSDPAAIALLMPGVIGFGATDSTGSAFSVAGQRIDQNQITLDGLSFGGSGPGPPPALRGPRAGTHTFDISEGRLPERRVAGIRTTGTTLSP